MGLVGGLDVHKGHGCGLAILVSFVTEDFHALDPSEPAMIKIKFRQISGIELATE